MAGAKLGCRAVVQKEAPLATYVHCAAHKLNLAIVSACKILPFKKYSVLHWRNFKILPKRQRLLENFIKTLPNRATAIKLKDACRTRWIESIDSFVVFLELLPSVTSILEAMADPERSGDIGQGWAWNADTVTKAHGYLAQLQSPSFLICFKILLQVFTCLRGLTTKLQKEESDFCVP